MATLTPLRVYTDVPQSAAPFIQDGDQVTVTVEEYPGASSRAPLRGIPMR